MKATKPVSIPEIPLVPTPSTPEGEAAIGFRWAGARVGTRHKLGGSPDWQQAPDVPTCLECTHPMSFYGQLDSIGDSFTLADCGLIYIFVCFDCFTTRSILQSR
jgi:hypothetical protein